MNIQHKLKRNFDEKKSLFIDIVLQVDSIFYFNFKAHLKKKTILQSSRR